MLYFLDSNVCIDYMRKGKKADLIDTKIFEVGPRNIKIPAIVSAELMHGAYKSKRPDETLNDTLNFLANFEIIAFDFPEADIYGQIRADLERKGKIIGYHDIVLVVLMRFIFSFKSLETDAETYSDKKKRNNNESHCRYHDNSLSFIKFTLIITTGSVHSIHHLMIIPFTLPMFQHNFCLWLCKIPHFYIFIYDCSYGLCCNFPQKDILCNVCLFSFLYKCNRLPNPISIPVPKKQLYLP